jgi:quercetin dioxygenase-like cupin family protein
MNNEKSKSGSQLIPSKAHDINGLVDYGDGAVVSKTIYKGKAATITLFSFDKGQGLSEHSAPFDAFVQIIDGQAELTIGGEKIITTTNEMVVMPANIPHAVYAAERFKMLLTMVREQSGE